MFLSKPAFYYLFWTSRNKRLEIPNDIGAHWQELTMRITSLQNKQIKDIVKLHARKHRDRRQKIIIEGHRAILRAVENHYPLNELYICPALFFGKKGEIFMMALKTFETTRLILRPLQMDDLDDLYRLIYADSEVRQYFTNISTFEGAQKKLSEKVRENETVDNQGFGYWGVLCKADGQFIGQILLGKPEPMPWIVLAETSDAFPLALEVELGYAFGKAYWGQGYATEACRAIVQYAFWELKLKRLMNAVLQVNMPSINLMKRLGFKIEENLHPDYDGVVGILNKPMFII
jgi:RimJ/RimL family protein N-acetyltransferase